MKKTLLLTLLLSGATILLVLMAVFLRTKELPTRTTIPVPTPLRLKSTTPITTPARHPNILPKELLKTEEDFLEQTPILQKLPYGHPYFIIDYISETHLIVYSKTTDREIDYQEARSWFAENDIDISKILIEYK